MAYDINAALERLETDLAEVESAKKQVEETIATSESLQLVFRLALSDDMLVKADELKHVLGLHCFQHSSIRQKYHCCIGTGKHFCH